MVEGKTIFNPDLKNIIVFAPLVVVAIFCLSFVQMKANNTQSSLKKDAGLTQHKKDSVALPLISQPALPTLNTVIETKTPPSVPPPNLTAAENSQKSDMVGPSPKNSGNAVQPNSGNPNSNSNHDLQATRKAIRLEEAKL